ncbi:ISL3 family transposase, partial [Acidithiobacillus thiooxidans]|uniref:ISL3 family transposase n=1 Tax=Acidithiobacillus thiooxidans TaxID=930 RepID=UPI001C0670A6
CGKTFMEALPAVNTKREMTDRLVRWIGQQSLKRTFASIADDTGLDEKTIRNIFRDYINELEAEFRFETPQWMGIDEIHIINKPRCVVSNIQNNTIVDMLHNRNKDTVTKYLFKMPNRDKVQYVAMDMWTPYRDAVSGVLPDATIVIDKFHVVRMANDAMEKTRKGLRGELTIKQKRGLMHDRFVLLKRERDLNDEECLSLDGWTKNYPALGEAYRLKEDFYGIYEAGTPDEAMRRYEAWYKGISTEIRPYFADLIRAFTNWQPFILNYFEHPVTNAYTESLNSLIRVMNRLGRGYSFGALRAKILFTEGAHKHKLSRPKFERRREPDLAMAEEVAGYDVPDDAMGYGLPHGHFGKAILMPRKSPHTAEHPHEPPGPPKNYGADINTLIELLESGRL